MRRIVCILCFVVRAALGSGGDVGGNGGYLVVCDQPGGGSSYELLDYFESVNGKPPLPLELGLSSWGASRKVEHALARLNALDPKRAVRYEAEATRFLSLVEWITQGPGLEPIPDLGPINLPAHCKPKPVAIRRKTFHPSIKPFLIDQRLWLKLSEDHRAGLMLHEIIYGEMRDLGQKTSVNARKFNGLVSSSVFEAMPVGDYEKLAKALFEEIQPLAFRADKFDVNALAGQPFVLSLRSLLLHPVKGPLTWRFLEPVPTWLKLDLVQETISGTPTAATVDPLALTLVVHDGDTGAIAQIRLSVK